MNDIASQNAPDRREDPGVQQRVACSDVTGLSCNFVSERDKSSLWAKRGDATDQLLAQLTTHITEHHKDHILSTQDIAELRAKITPR